MVRRFRVAAALAALVVLTGCAPEVDASPSPSPTGFASEEAAFAAAEDTYRAYIDALNQVDLSDPATFEPIFALTTGDANDADRQQYSELHADNVERIGESVVTLVVPSVREGSSIRLDVCVDVTSVDFVASTGDSIVSPERPDMQRGAVVLVEKEDAPLGWLIETFAGRDDGPSC